MPVDIKIEFVDYAKIAESFKSFPERAKNASLEAMKSTGYHLQQKIRSFIEGGGSGWAAKSIMAERKKSGSASPLYALGQFVRYKVSGKTNAHMKVGFITGFRFSKAIRGIARTQEKGKRQRVTESYGLDSMSRISRGGMRGLFASQGLPLRKTTKFITIPRRPMVSAVYDREKQWINDFFAMKFWDRFTGKEKD